MSVLRSLYVVLVASVAVGCAMAAEPTPAAPSKEMRSTMAAAHEKMAACLRSDKAIDVCRAEMKQACAAMHGQGCHMMGEGMGMGMRKGMKEPETEAADEHQH